MYEYNIFAMMAIFLASFVLPAVAQENPDMHPYFAKTTAQLQQYAGTCAHITRDRESENYELRMSPNDDRFYGFNIHTDMIVLLHRASNLFFLSNDHHKCRSSEIGLDINSGKVLVGAYAMCQGMGEYELVDVYRANDGFPIGPELKNSWKRDAAMLLDEIDKIIALCRAH